MSDSAVCNQSLCDLIPPECKYGEKLVSYYRQDSCCPDYVCGEFFSFSFLGIYQNAELFH